MLNWAAISQTTTEINRGAGSGPKASGPKVLKLSISKRPGQIGLIGEFLRGFVLTLRRILRA